MSSLRLRSSHIKWYILILIFLYFAFLLFIRSQHYGVSDAHRGSMAGTHANLQRYMNDRLTTITHRNNLDLISSERSTEKKAWHPPLSPDSPLYHRDQDNIDASSVTASSNNLHDPLSEDQFLVKKSALPAFAADESEFILGSLIERSFDSWDLHITTLMLCHFMLEPTTSSSGMGVDKVHPLMKEKWKRAVTKFMDVAYFPSGRRLPSPAFYCKISNTATSTVYLVEGSFVPNRLTSDSNANRRMDIFRCRMQDAEYSYSHLAGSEVEEVSVEILRESLSLVNFTIPWDTRRAGYLFSHPPAASQLDAWGGRASGPRGSSTVVATKNDTRLDDTVNIGQDTIPSLPNAASNTVIHICVPGTRQFPSKATLPLFLEFVSHHLLLGVDHIHLPLLLGWNSPHMARFMDVFRSYIRQGKLSIGSQAGDGVDMVHSLAGMTWSKNAVKLFQANACLYTAKGLADYLLLMDVDEFFIPRINHGHRSILDVITAVEASTPISAPESSQVLEEIKEAWAGGRGLADGEAHPFCYMKLTSEVYVNRRSGAFVDFAHPWMGQRFTHGPETTNDNKVFRYMYHKPILPTAKIYQAGLNTGGACRLPLGWTSCGAGQASVDSKGVQEFCGDGTGEPRRMGRMKNGEYFDFRGDHNFDEIVTEKDARSVDSNREAVIAHFLLFHQTIAATPETLMNTSDYTKHFFQNVLQDLRTRNLELLVLMPDAVLHPPTADEQWLKFFTKEEVQHASAFNSIKAAVKSSPAGKYNPPMPQNFSTRHTERGDKIVPLPYFSYDLSEYVLGAMIERVSDSFDLYLTVFFLCHGLLEPKVGLSAVSGEKVHRDMVGIWKKAMAIMETTPYHDNGMRQGPPYYHCKITHADGGKYKSYIVRGMWVPSRLTPDSNSNRRMDIFRCKMEDTEDAYKKLARSSEHVTVEIIRDSVPLLAFRVPWSSRSAGYMLEYPYAASTIDPWKGYDGASPGQWKHDRLYMCVPGLETAPSKSTLPLYLEFVEHHLQLGVDHFFLSALFHWDSRHMHTLLRVFDSYIKEGTVSFSSSAGDGFDLVYSTAGLQWGRDNVKNFQVNMCTYFAKGMADFVGIWDFDEHFIPLGNNSNILDLIDSIEAPLPIPYLHDKRVNTDVYPHWNGQAMGKGLADRDGHPLCYIILNSVVTLFAQAHTAVDPLHPWLGERFSHGAERVGHGLGFKKSIRPTRTIFQGGLHLAGACRLPKPWNGCQKDVDFCYNEGPSLGQVFRLTKFPNGTAINFNLNHRFDEVTLEQDAYTVNSETQAFVNHLQYHRFWFGASAEALQVKSQYTSRFYDRVRDGLDRRDLVLPIVLPELQQKPFPLPDHEWIDLAVVHQEVDAVALRNGGKYIVDPAEMSSQNSPMMPTFTAQLPLFAHDKSELALGAIVERESDSFNLFLTTFFLSHAMIEPKDDGTQALRIRNSSMATWKAAIVKFKDAQYLPNGKRRRSPKFFCKISNAAGETPYIVEGSFIANRLTPDIGANRRLDTLRCPMQRSEEAYKKLSRHATAAVQVEIFRDSVSIMSFAVPWATRTNGKAMHYHPHASQFDPWFGYDPNHHGRWIRDKVHMCVPGLESPPSKKNLPIYLEFLQHHINMGVKHIFLAASFTWSSPHMARLLRILKSFIDDKLVSINSHPSDDADFLYSFEGLSWMRDNIKINQVNMCTFLSKGVADYVAIWDVDEFFIPKGQYRNIIDVIEATEPALPPLDHSLDASKLSDVEKMKARKDALAQQQIAQVSEFLSAAKSLRPHEARNLWQATPRRGFADRDGHPYCYIQMNSQVIPNREAISQVDMDHLWIGEQFAHGSEPGTSRLGLKFSFKKSIIPTANMFQIGLHMSGACRLPWRWNGCNDPNNEFCHGTTGEPKRRYDLDLDAQPFNAEQRFDEIVTDDDTRKISVHKEASLYHFMLYRFYHAASNASILETKNDYTSKFFNATMSELRRRNLDLLITIPFEAPREHTADQSWIDYNTVWAARKTDPSSSLFTSR